MKTENAGGISPKTPWAEIDGGGRSGWVDFRPGRVRLPMCQSDEAPCRPLVKAGEKVRVYQRVGEAVDRKSVHIHSGVSGTVAAIHEETNAVTGATETVVVIDNDGLDEETPLQGLGETAEPDRESLRGILREAGIVGMGGAAFPSHLKLGGGGLDVLIVNGAECEPVLCADAALMVERPGAVLDGCRLIMGALGIPAAIVGIEGNRPEALASMQTLVEGRRDARVEILPHVYPVGGEKLLVQRLTGREVPAGKLPSDVGVMVFNVATLAAVADAVRRGAPLAYRICSVVGDVAIPRNVRLPIGSSARDVIAFCGGWVGTPSRLILGGPMMGRASGDPDVPLLKTANGLLLVNREHDIATEERPCIRCNRCSGACPVRLMPQFIDAAARRDDWREGRRLTTESCINCGCCSYVCPSRIPLAANITQMAGKLKKMRKEG